MSEERSIYLVEKCGWHVRLCIGVFNTFEEAQAYANRAAEQEPDMWHSMEVSKRIIGKDYLTPEVSSWLFKETDVEGILYKTRRQL